MPSQSRSSVQRTHSLPVHTSPQTMLMFQQQGTEYSIIIVINISSSSSSTIIIIININMGTYMSLSLPYLSRRHTITLSLKVNRNRCLPCAKDNITWEHSSKYQNTICNLPIHSLRIYITFWLLGCSHHMPEIGTVQIVL